MTQPIRWGIVGTGRIIHRWLPDLFLTPGAVLSAICSTDAEKARGIAGRYAPEALCFDDIAAFTASGAVDIAYIATSHPYHLSFTKHCLEAGIPVLCEKPLTPNAAQAKELIAAAQQTGVFLMEGMWTRFFPAMEQVLGWLADGRIGRLIAMRGSFTGGPLRHDPADRVVDPAQGGGALLDIGVYLLHCAAMVFGGLPRQLTSFSTMGESGVDVSANILLRYPGGGTASLFCSLEVKDDDGVTLLGDKGKITIAAPFWRPLQVTLETEEGTVSGSYAEQNEGFRHEILHVQQCVEQGLAQSPVMPLSRTLEVLELCDYLRRQWGLAYPFDPA